MRRSRCSSGTRRSSGGPSATAASSTPSPGGLAAATGEVVAIQSSDDYYLRGAIARAAAALRDDPGIDFVTGNDVFIGEDGQPKYPIPKPYITLTNPGAMFGRTTALYIPQHCTFARRSAIDRVGGAARGGGLLRRH